MTENLTIATSHFATDYLGFLQYAPFIGRLFRKNRIATRTDSDDMIYCFDNENKKITHGNTVRKADLEQNCNFPPTRAQFSQNRTEITSEASNNEDESTHIEENSTEETEISNKNYEDYWEDSPASDQYQQSIPETWSEQVHQFNNLHSSSTISKPKTVQKKVYVRFSTITTEKRLDKPKKRKMIHIPVENTDYLLYPECEY